MGGFGSGMGMRFNTTRTKGFVESYRSIDARMFPFKVMQKIPDAGITLPLHGVNTLVKRDHMELLHGQGENKSTIRIEFDFSRGNYGNSRYWMRCPLLHCKRRCRKLYLIRVKEIACFVCRCCLNLAYRSQNRTALDRIIDKKWGLVHKLKCDSDNICDREKPKWMHWKTFNRTRDQIEELHDIADAAIFGRFQMDGLGEDLKPYQAFKIVSAFRR